MKNSLIFAAMAFGMFLPATGQAPVSNEEVISKIIEIGTTDNKVMHHLDVLNNRFGGRPIGSDAYENAADWLIRELSLIHISEPTRH